MILQSYTSCFYTIYFLIRPPYLFLYYIFPYTPTIPDLINSELMIVHVLVHTSSPASTDMLDLCGGVNI